MKQLVSILVCSLMIPSMVFGGQIATVPIQATEEATVLLPAVSPAKEMPVLVAHVTDADREALRAEVAKSPQKSHSWDTFWDVHFGGYRWAWWALAGGVLIAIHAAN